ncbi:hypothetical protein K1719_032728 [Acacia pycnantha]|nr:hypothetical protein K1719_032728 [Acacia pycnantha]
MTHEKESSPPILEESSRSTKKVRIRTDGATDGEETKSTGTDTVMADKVEEQVVSYRNKLLNGDGSGMVSQPQKEVNLNETDFQITREGDVPSIVFSEAVRATLSKGMEKTLVLKLLGRSITYYDLKARIQALWRLKGSFSLVDMEGSFYFATFDLEEDYFKALTGGPWMIFSAYLTVQPWSLDFDARSSAISKVVAWARISGLSFKYYHKSTLRAIGSLLGEVVKIDYLTETKGRGKYARIAVLMDLLKPLVPWIMVDGKKHGVEYEGHLSYAMNVGCMDIRGRDVQGKSIQLLLLQPQDRFLVKLCQFLLQVSLRRRVPREPRRNLHRRSLDLGCR